MSSNWRLNYDRRESSRDFITLSSLSSNRNEANDKILHRQQVCENFIAAYDGSHSNFLGGDVPSKKHNLFARGDHCTLLLSTSQTSQLLIAPAEFPRYRYRAFSQDPSIEIYFGRKVYNPDNEQDEFACLATLEINADQLTAPVVRKFMPEVTPSSFRQALKDTLGAISSGDAEIESALNKVRNPYVENGVNCMTFAIAKGRLSIRDTHSQSRTQCSLALSLQSQLLGLKYVTVIRRAERNTLGFGDELWDYMVQRCLKDGVFWAYGLPQRKLTDLNDTEEGEIVEENVSMRALVARGKLAAPRVSWCTWTREEWRDIVEKAKRIEGERSDWEAEKYEAQMKDLNEERGELDLEQTQQRERDAVAEVALQEWLVEERGQWSQTIWCMILLQMAVYGVSIVICRGLSSWAPSCYTYFC
jgi:hypothetical protein